MSHSEQKERLELRISNCWSWSWFFVLIFRENFAFHAFLRESLSLFQGKIMYFTSSSCTMMLCIYNICPGQLSLYRLVWMWQLKCEGSFDAFFVTMTQGTLCLCEDQTMAGNQIGLSLPSVHSVYCCTYSTMDIMNPGIFVMILLS